MHLYEIIFSKKIKHILFRHFAFWFAWWLYFLFCYILFQQPNPNPEFKPMYQTPGNLLPIKTFLWIILYAAACYPLIYYILTEIIYKNWINAILYIAILYLLLFASSYYLYWYTFPALDSTFNPSKANDLIAQSWPAINLGLINFTKVAAAAIIIKYVKYSWRKQRENQQLEKEKVKTELELLKAQLYPEFLFETLANISSTALSTSSQTSGMLLKLSDLLSFMLYECDQPLIKLENEIIAIKKYMNLEKFNRNDNSEIELNMKGILNNQMIAPFILLPFLENSFKNCGQNIEKFWVNLDIKLDGIHFTMKLANGISTNVSRQALLETTELRNAQKRLTLLYPDNHEIKLIREQEMFIVLLHISLMVT